MMESDQTSGVMAGAAPPPSRAKGLLVILLMAGILGGGALFWFWNLPATESAGPLVPKSEFKRSTPPQRRDLERYRNMSSLRIAADSFFNLNKRYPKTLAELKPKFLETIPTDPSTGTEYGYRTSGSDYEISFKLEFGAFALSPGDHIATNRGFDLPVSGLPENPGFRPK